MLSLDEELLLAVWPFDVPFKDIFAVSYVLAVVHFKCLELNRKLLQILVLVEDQCFGELVAE